MTSVNEASARRSPLIRKAVVHFGMPKAGSTSIQVALHAAQDSRLTPHGIWFTPPRGEFNDARLYDPLTADDAAGVRAYVQTKVEAAVAAGADTVIFSAERLFTMDRMKERVAQLGAVLREFADEVCFVVVVREMRTFLRSYIIQMIYNCGVSLEDYRMAEWTADQTRAVAEAGFPAVFIPLMRDGDPRNIAEAMVGISTGREIDLDSQVANVTPGRPLIYALAEGLAARLHAIGHDQDVNAVGMDAFRTEFAETYDQAVYASSDPGEVYHALQRVNKLLEGEILQYIDRCCTECDPEKLSYYNNLVRGDAGVTASSEQDRDLTPPMRRRKHEGSELSTDFGT